MINSKSAGSIGSNQNVHIVVTDMIGRPLIIMEGATNQTFSFGGQFISGIYIVKIMQGKDTQTLKVVKA